MKKKQESDDDLLEDISDLLKKNDAENKKFS